MTNYSETLDLSPSRSKKEHQILTLADSCFEMYPTNELRRPQLILGELQSAFPELDQKDILYALSLALTWRRLLQAAGRPLH